MDTDKSYNSYKDYNNYNDYKGYKGLPFFRQAEIIHDFTVEFCQKYIDYKSRTKDQMEQAARSGKQNIAEGYLQKSLEGKIHLLKVSRGSFEELLNDYLDFLRQRNLPLWAKEDPRSKAIRALVYKDYKSYNNYNDYKNYLGNPEQAANAMICLINQTNELLDQKLRWTEEKFTKEGGAAENLRNKRKEFIKNRDSVIRKEEDNWLKKEMESRGYKQLVDGRWVEL